MQSGHLHMSSCTPLLADTAGGPMAALAVIQGLEALGVPGQELQIQHNETYYMILMCRKMIICHCNMHVTHINTKAYMITRIYSRHSIIIQHFFIYLIHYMHHSGTLCASLTAIASSGRRHYSMSVREYMEI